MQKGTEFVFFCTLYPWMNTGNYGNKEGNLRSDDQVPVRFSSEIRETPVFVFIADGFRLSKNTVSPSLFGNVRQYR
jgi:hypothetical protein